MKLKFSVLLMCLLVPVLVAAQTPEVEWIRGTDFSRFHTFTWATAVYPIQDPDANLGMARAVQEELAGKGVEFVSPQQKFDVFVTYNAKINSDPADMARRFCSVKVRMFEARNNAVVWQAGGSVELGNDKLQNRRNVRALLAAMFQKYPPE